MLQLHLQSTTRRRNFTIREIRRPLVGDLAKLWSGNYLSQSKHPVRHRLIPLERRLTLCH
jgi:hypothetical protein